MDIENKTTFENAPLGAGGEIVDGFSLFSSLVNILGTSTKNTEKLNALQHYFSTASDKDKVWVIAIFSGRRPKRIVNSTTLQQWCIALIDLPLWLFEESYHTVGDLAETIALLLPPPTTPLTPKGELYTLSYYLEQFIVLEKQEESVKKDFIISTWMQLNQEERFVFNKLITGGFRIGVSQKMMVNALAKTTKIEASTIAHLISGNWDPSTIRFNDLMSQDTAGKDDSKPYPFYLAYALEDAPQSLGDITDWQAEWKWDGIRGQMIKRNGELYVWSRGEELMTDKFPEYQILKTVLPDGMVIDGEILPTQHLKPLPFSLLQTRIGRKTITKKQLQEAPISFFAYDLLEYNTIDIRTKPLEERRELLENMIHQLLTNQPHIANIIQLSPTIQASGWDELIALRQDSRDMGSEGLMLKRKASPYQVGRKVGDWWKWKIEPMVIDAVLIYAQKGHGRRSNLYTDYTFAVKEGDKLVTFTKAYSGLTDKEFNEVDAFVKANSIEKFGPVRTVKPALVFEIAFEGIAASARHKSGVALRFPRMNRWRKDKKADEINTLDDLKNMLRIYGNKKDSN
ncbi:ATP-dependent DNA ligase [Parasediminibacterium paludis]|uniref:DNA ligase (ATP) n=1 Tax=Parasediminibacterium paludis TaxID=908966 RepID=A0ABV8PX36_9BACT